MTPSFVVAGLLQREFILPARGTPALDRPGGSALYAAGGLLVWDSGVGLLARLGEDYPRPWLKEWQARGIDTTGITILPEPIETRLFLAYNERLEVGRENPVSHFAQRGLPFPKALLGYRNPTGVQKEAEPPRNLAPVVAEIPAAYREARAVHFCPLDFASHRQLILAFKAGLASTLTLDPAPEYMNPALRKDLRAMLTELTAFLPSEEALQRLFWGETRDVWEMAEAIGEYGCQVVVVKCGARGQRVYDAVGKRKWEVQAYPVQAADPTGVGDAFCGGFLAGYQKTCDPLQATLYGNISASLKIEGSGAFCPLDVLPGLAEARLEASRDLVRRV